MAAKMERKSSQQLHSKGARKWKMTNYRHVAAACAACCAPVSIIASMEFGRLPVRGATAFSSDQDDEEAGYLYY
jgi:hypothetical protein